MIYYSNFGVAAPATDIVIAVQDFTTGTTTGLKSYTSSLISGVTPKAALLINSYHAPANDGSETPHAQFNIGMLDATAYGSITGLSRDANATTSTRSSGDQNRGWWTLIGTSVGSIDKRSTTASPISGGVSLNFDTNSATDRRGVFVAFAGADVEAKVIEVNLLNSTSPIDITTVGFEPEVVIVLAVGEALTGTNEATLTYSMGVAHWNGTTVTQRCILGAEDDAIADGTPFQAILTDAVGGQINDATGALTYKFALSGFDSSGFTITPSAAAGNDHALCLCLKLNGRSAKLVDLSTPTATGSSTVTGAGFTPQFALAFLTNLEAVDPTFSLTSSDLMGGLSINAIGNEQWATTIRIDSGAATTDTASASSNTAIQSSTATSVSGVVASLTGFTSDGMTLNYSAVQGTAKKGFILFME